MSEAAHAGNAVSSRVHETAMWFRRLPWFHPWSWWIGLCVAFVALPVALGSAPHRWAFGLGMGSVLGLKQVALSHRYASTQELREGAAAWRARTPRRRQGQLTALLVILPIVFVCLLFGAFAQGPGGLQTATLVAMVLVVPADAAVLLARQGVFGPRRPAGWYPDPMYRFDHRYWDGQHWTEYVSRAGIQVADPLRRHRERP